MFLLLFGLHLSNSIRSITFSDKLPIKVSFYSPKRLFICIFLYMHRTARNRVEYTDKAMEARTNRKQVFIKVSATQTYLHHYNSKDI